MECAGSVLRKGGPFVLSEHGEKGPQSQLRGCASTTFAPQWLTPVERPSFTIRRLDSSDRGSFLCSMIRWMRRDSKNWASIQFCLPIPSWHSGRYSVSCRTRYTAAGRRRAKASNTGKAVWRANTAIPNLSASSRRSRNCSSISTLQTVKGHKNQDHMRRLTTCPECLR